jgi:hypothetical protein
MLLTLLTPAAMHGQSATSSPAGGDLQCMRQRVVPGGQVAGMRFTEVVRTRCNATLHGPGYGTRRCLKVDWDRTANTLCFHHGRAFGRYEVKVLPQQRSRRR